MHASSLIVLFGLTALLLAGCASSTATEAGPRVLAPGEKLKVAAVVTEYRHNSHADVVVSRLFQTDTLDGKGRVYPVELVSLYTDQVPKNDTSRKFAKEYGFPIYPTVEEALTLGTGKLAVDAVLLVAEHGEYPRSKTTNIEYPKRRLFEEVVKVFQKSGRVVPVFIDKHLADNWEDINYVYETAKRMHIPLLAGSSVPLTWRRPAETLAPGARLDQIVGISYHTLDAYGFHALEVCQSIAEKRAGGETGIKSVRTLSDEQVWQAMEKPEYDPALFDAAMAALSHPLGAGKPLRERVPHPTLFIIEHKDGLKVYIFTLNGAVNEWSAAWKTKEGKRQATLFFTQEARPFYHFAMFDDVIFEMFETWKPAYPVERTLLTSGSLDALLISKMKGGERVETPYLEVGYHTDWEWRQPAPPPPDRPVMEQ